ncbi:hypothetical protein J5N97_004378 [Dioscorea zingiberensis]|uniref:Myb/SANT-like DNA-binding domain-containing protein n=1 Tax=Dioscorea zingiberensis TaxID=325984 RepID=A0A9D5D7X4_9LILI|nr:hypothetical protein J5N97_004378 [Dioscorea zingiberensis]
MEAEGRPRPPNPAMPYREDCWSEGATETLIDAWGGRYLELNRGNLRQKDWQEVADSVNSRPGAARRAPRTDVQCKNRIDTLKKKYKAERARVSNSGGALGSQWPFFSRLDDLIGSTTPVKIPLLLPPPPSPPMALPLPSHRKGLPLPVAAAAAAAAASLSRDKRPAPVPIAMDDSLFRRSFMAAAAAKEEVEESDESGSSRSSRSSKGRYGRGWKRRRVEGEGEGEGDGDGIRELAKAIEMFADMYERVEEAKQRQMIEMEKKRMEFAKGLEVQRMKMFVDCQIQIEKIKRSNRADPGSYP